MHMKQVYKHRSKQLVALEYKRLYIIMIIIYSYLERDNDKVFKFHMNNLCFFLNKHFFSYFI